MRRAAVPVWFASLALVACSGESNDGSSSTSGAGASTKPPAELVSDASAAIDAKKFDQALASAQAALGDPRASAEEKSHAWTIRIHAEAELHGEDAAKKAVGEMNAAGIKLEVEQYRDLGYELANANAATVALELLDAAKQAYGADPKVNKGLKSLAKYVQAKLAESGDSEGLAKLQSLGYLGGGDDDEDDEEAEKAPKKDGPPQE